MSSPTPPRRFKPEPVETTVKSSKHMAPVSNDPPKSRRFAPEPLETSTKTSRKYAPEPVETTQKTNRKFSPEPLETSTKTNRKFAPEPVETTQKTNRKFAPMPLETSVKSNAVKKGPDAACKAPRKFQPEPIETTSSSNRKEDFEKTWSPTFEKREKKPPRKFAPQLIETAKRSRKAGDMVPALLPSDRTEAISGANLKSPKQTRIQEMPDAPVNTPTSISSTNPLFLEIQRATSSLPIRRPSVTSIRSQHSFRVPDLEPIESSESEGSSPPSLSTSPSAGSDHSYMYKEATRMRESVDERFSGYLLQLAARAAEKQLREQAMAAFPNDDYHEPVDHFIGRDSDEQSESGSLADDNKRRRDSSFTMVNWELEAMRRHRERREQEEATEREKKRKKEADMNRGDHSAHNPWGSPLANTGENRNIVGGWQKDNELDGMRKGARPPMLGADIRFPRCSSPEPARFDPTQGSQAVRSAMCYLTEQSQASENGEGLWCGKGKSGKSGKSSAQLSLWSTPNSRQPSKQGLWGGCCVDSGESPPRGPSGLLTPRIEIGNPIETPAPSPAHKNSLLPPTPPASNADIASIDEKLSRQLAIEEDFGDDFVTQVYNYLSLGYPSIARDFDNELSKISHIPVSELRQDDQLATSRGYIRLGEDGNLTEAEITEENCSRWRALRVYVREWAVQQPKMNPGESLQEGIGVAVRRGSWAI